jgi:dTDP-glucose 4,6-dehydratase
VKALATADLDHVLAGLGPRLAALHRTRIFVTGGTGFVGSWLIESIAYANRTTQLGCEVTALVLPEEAHSERAEGLRRLRGVQVVLGDVRRLALRDNEVRASVARSFDAVIHAAIHVDATTIAHDPIPTLDSAVDGTRSVLEFARVIQARRFLFVSSGAVYGAQPPSLDQLDEAFAGAPQPFSADAVYAEGKRIGETMCACYARSYGLEAIVARCFAFVGPRLPLDRHFAMGNFIRDALAGGPIIVQGDGMAVRSYLHAADLTVWLLALLCDGAPGRAYNVGSPAGVAIGDVANLVAAAAGPRVRVEVRGTATPGVPPNRYVPSVQRAQDELGLTVGLSLPESIMRTLTWHGLST